MQTAIMNADAPKHKEQRQKTEELRSGRKKREGGGIVSSLLRYPVSCHTFYYAFLVNGELMPAKQVEGRRTLRPGASLGHLAFSLQCE